jgi:hypothetical protein
MKCVSEGLPNSRGPRPNRWIYIPGQECGRRLNCYFIRYDFVSKYYKTVGCNFWQPQGSHFAAKFVIGTPPETKGVFDAVRNCRGHGPNRWDTYLDRHLKEKKFLFFFGLNSSSNAIIRFDATFGSRRGAILQQYSESAHHHI